MLSKKVVYSDVLDFPNDILDVNLLISKRKVIRFSLNYRSLIKKKWHDIYRIDNHHGYLHEQRFWLSADPIPLEETEKMYTTNYIVEIYVEKIHFNYPRYKKYYIESLKKKN